MNIVSSYVFFFFTGAFQVYFLFAFLDVFLQPRLSSTRHKIFRIVAVILTVVLLYVSSFYSEYGDFVYELILFIVTVAIYGKIFYKNKVFAITKPSPISIATIYLACVVLLSAVAGGVAILISGGGDIAGLTYDFDNIFQPIVYILIGRVPILVAYVIIKKRMKERHMLFTSYFLYLVCASAVIMIVLLFPLYSTFAFSEDLSDIIAFLSVTFLLAAFLFIVLNVLYHRIKLSGQQAQLDLIRLRNELLNKNLNDVKHLHHERGRLAHDMKEHLSVIYSLAQVEGNEKLCTYIKKIHSPLKDIVRIENTGCEFLDIILTVKKQQALKLGVAMDIDCSITTPLNIEPVDLTAILSNLLENALEACEKIENCDERYVFVTIKSQGAFLKIRIENSADDTLIKQNMKMRTTKKNKELHGIGLKSVKSSVERYKGDIIFEQQDGVFIVSIVLCLDF